MSGLLFLLPCGDVAHSGQDQGNPDQQAGENDGRHSVIQLRNRPGTQLREAQLVEGNVGEIEHRRAPSVILTVDVIHVLTRLARQAALGLSQQIAAASPDERSGGAFLGAVGTIAGGQPATPKGPGLRLRGKAMAMRLL